MASAEAMAVRLVVVRLMGRTHSAQAGSLEGSRWGYEWLVVRVCAKIPPNPPSPCIHKPCMDYGSFLEDRRYHEREVQIQESIRPEMRY